MRYIVANFSSGGIRTIRTGYKWKLLNQTLYPSNFPDSVKSAIVVFSAEVVATALLMFLGCMGGVKGFKDTDTPSVQGAAVFGMTVCSLIQVITTALNFNV